MSAPETRQWWPNRASLGSGRMLAILSAASNLLWLAAWLSGAANWIVLAGAAIASASGLAFAAIGALGEPAHPPGPTARLSTLTSREVFAALDAAVGKLDAHLFDWDLASDTLSIDDSRLANCGSPVAATAFLPTVHPDDQALFKSQIDAALHDRETFQIEYRAVHADASVHFVEMHGRVLRAADHTPLRILGAVIDIGQRRATLQALEEQTRKLDRLFESYDLAASAADLGVWDWDLTTNTLATDRNMLRIFDRETAPPAPNAQAFLHDILHADDRAEFLAVTSAAVKDRTRSEVEHRFRYVRSNGEVRHAQLVGRLVRDSNGWATRLLAISWNITAQVIATQEIARKAAMERDLLDRLNLATEAAGITVWEWDLVRNRTMFEADVVRRYGAEQTGANGNALANIRATVHPDDLASFDAGSVKAVQAPDAFKNRYRICRLDGAYRHVETITRVLRNPRGKPARILGVTRDVTEEVEHAHHLRDIERRLERASLSSSEGHFEWDYQKQTAWYSSSFHALLGYAEGSLPGGVFESLALLQLPEDVPWQREKFEAHIEQGAPYKFETRLRTGSGETRWFSILGTAERDPQGRPERMAGSIHDIHQQRLAEAALQLAQQRLERAITGTQDGLWELEASGAAWCSPRVGELLGHASGELPEDTNFLTAFLHEDDRESVAAATAAHFHQAAPYDVEIRLRTRTGEYRWYRARASAERDAHKQPLRLSGSLQDITEARAAREALVKATEAAQAASRAKSDFLANVSHEIRTPMNGIVGMTHLLLDTRLDGTQQDYAEIIRSSAGSLLTVINDILDFSKVEAGKLDIEKIEMDVREQVEEVGAMLALQASEKALELIINVRPEVPERVLGDPQRVRQCLVNLVGNAIKFTPQGEVVVEVGIVGRQDGRPLVHFEVRDTGIGIAEATLQTLFQPFVQGDSSTTRHFGGTGLGLSIVRRLTEMMGGMVGAASQAGQGSTFWFTLPMDEVAAAVNPGDLHQAGGRVLVVDDNATCRDVAASYLHYAGFDVVCAAHASHALELLHRGQQLQRPFDVVLIDHQMPDMDGPELGRRIRAVAEFAATHLVLLTSLAKRSEGERTEGGRGVDPGFVAQLSKPLRYGELLACLRRALAVAPARSDTPTDGHARTSFNVRCVSPTRNSQYQGRVLLTEDNPVNQKVALRFLQRLGLTVTIASNGAQALAALSEQDFDMILMDLQMPVMDGLTATRSIRARELECGHTPTPIIALTANAMVGQLEVCMGAGMNAFLTKPLEVDRLVEIVELYLLPKSSASENSLPQSAQRRQPSIDGTVGREIPTTARTGWTDAGEA